MKKEKDISIIWIALIILVFCVLGYLGGRYLLPYVTGDNFNDIQEKITTKKVCCEDICGKWSWIKLSNNAFEKNCVQVYCGRTGIFNSKEKFCLDIKERLDDDGWRAG